MGPLIDSELERVDRKHAQLTQLSADLVEALSLYHTLMREPALPSISKLPYGYPPSNTVNIEIYLRQECSIIFLFFLFFLRLSTGISLCL